LRKTNGGLRYANPPYELCPSTRQFSTSRFVKSCKLIGEQGRQQLLHLRNVYLAVLKGQICCVQCIEIRLTVIHNLIRNRWRPRQNGTRPDREHKIGNNSRSAAVAISERMNPIQSPHHLCGQMDRCALLPMLIDVVAHILD